MARRVLAYLRRSGVSATVTASALMEAIWRRGDEDYLMEAEEFFMELDLPIDVDRCRSDDLQAEAHALIRWVEDGLWEEFVDHLEGLVGESQQVGDARSQQTLSAEEREAWWQWAERHAPETTRARSRSRSPARSRESDTASLMDRGGHRPTPKKKAHPGRGRDRGDRDEGDGRDPGGDRGRDRRDSGRDDGRRRVPPRSRSARVAARVAGRASGSTEDPGRRVTQEVRRLTPRGCRAPPMTIGNATCFWLHTLGLRNGTAVDDRRALDPQAHDGRMGAVMGVRPEDLVMVMAALMRTLAMLVVESSQLMMMRVQQQPPPTADEEVEVTVEAEDGDEEVWMQTHLQRGSKRACTEEEQLAEDEREAAVQRVAEDMRAEGQQDEREEEEAAQGRQDEALWEQHRAARYRDWEQWEVANFIPSAPKRLRVALRLQQGGAAEQVVCSVPLVRGRPIELGLTLHEQAGASEDVSGPLVADDAGGTVAAAVEARHVAGYDEWKAVRSTEEQVVQQFGVEMLAMYKAQYLVERDSGYEEEGLTQGSEGPPRQA